MDQLSKIRGKAGASKFDTFTDNTNAIALLKKELRIPLIILCQTKRNVEKHSDQPQQLSNLKQSGSPEDDADIVMTVYRAGYRAGVQYSKIPPSATENYILKNRQGPIGVEKQVMFNPKLTTFEL